MAVLAERCVEESGSGSGGEVKKGIRGIGEGRRSRRNGKSKSSNNSRGKPHIEDDRENLKQAPDLRYRRSASQEVSADPIDRRERVEKRFDPVE